MHGDDGEGARAHDEDAAEALERLGYAQELLRRMGGFSSFAVSFSIISVLTGCITAYADAIGPGGPVALGLGWPLVSLGTMLVALAMAELASAFPTAGALYHWSALLGGPGWGWLTASMNIVGQIAIVAAIDYGLAGLLAATLGLSPEKVLPLYALVLASHAAVNAVSVRLVAILNDFSATVHVVGVLVIVGALFAFGRAQPVEFLFRTGFTTREDGSAVFGFANGLVLSMFTFTGYDASAHLSEETHDPARAAPKGILASVGISAVAGYLLLAAITLAIRDLPAVAADRDAALSVMTSALGSSFGKAAMGVALAAMWFCGLSSITSASRTLYAFSRDRGIPFAAAFARVHASLRTPVAAILAVTFGPLLLVLATSLASNRLFDAMAKMATMGLYVSYAAPILLGALARRAGRWRTMGPFSLGRYGTLVAWAAVGWSAFVLVVCSVPPNALPAAMLVGVVASLGLLWTFVVKTRFEGPRVTLAALEAGSSTKSDQRRGGGGA